MLVLNVRQVDTNARDNSITVIELSSYRDVMIPIQIEALYPRPAFIRFWEEHFISSLKGN